jgi:hypothetical protein
MKHYLRFTSCALAALGFAHSAAAAPAGTLLFTQPGTQIVSATGTARAATKGEVLQTGERLLTPAGAISQVLLPDGSLIGMRSESELKIDAAPASSDSKAPVVNLVNGTARVIGAELMDNKKMSNFSLQSGSASVKLKGADLESAVVKADARSTGGEAAPGSYQRLLVGAGTVANGSQVTALAPREVSYTGTINTGSVTVATPSQNLFGGGANRGTGQPPAGAGASDKGSGNNNANAIAPPKLANIMAQLKAPTPLVQPVVQPVVAPPAVVPAVRPCTRFIGKTCIQ